jgi:hypothetical protein
MWNRFLFIFFSALLGFAALCTLTCAKRDNPFDPLNYREMGSMCPPDSLLNFRTNVLFQLAYADQSIAVVRAYADTMRADSSAKYGIFAANNAKAAANKITRDQNAIIGSINRSTANPDSLQPKSFLDAIMPIVLNQTYNDTFIEKKGRIETILLKTRALIAGFESSCSGNKTAVQSFNDSALAIISADSAYSHDLSAGSTVLLKALNDSSAAIALYNAAIISENAQLQFYNENIAWLSKTIAFPHFSTPDSLLAGIAAAVPGDTFIIEGELY